MCNHMKRLGYFVVVAITRPFEFEGSRKLEQADALIEVLAETAPIVVRIRSHHFFWWMERWMCLFLLLDWFDCYCIVIDFAETWSSSCLIFLLEAQWSASTWKIKPFVELCEFSHVAIFPPTSIYCNSEAVQRNWKGGRYIGNFWRNILKLRYDSITSFDILPDCGEATPSSEIRGRHDNVSGSSYCWDHFTVQCKIYFVGLGSSANIDIHQREATVAWQRSKALCKAAVTSSAKAAELPRYSCTVQCRTSQRKSAQGDDARSALRRATSFFLSPSTSIDK